MLSKSDKLAKLSESYLDKAGKESNPTLLNTPTNTPVNQLSFSAPNTQMPTTPPKFQGGQTWVPGVGLMGADVGGAVKGDMLRQEYAMNAAGNNRAEEQLGMAKTKLSMDQDYMKMAEAELGIKLDQASMVSNSYAQQQAIQKGMVDAAQEGGYGAVIDYLKTADPKMALEFESEKLKLDHGIMENATFQNSHINDQAKVMLEGYSLLGSFGSTLFNTPPDKRQDVYKELLPMMKQIDPKMPNQLDDAAVGKMMLGMTLATPASQLYSAEKQTQKFQSTQGKLMADYSSAVDKYGTNSKEAVFLQQAMEGEANKAQEAKLKAVSLMAQDKVSGESSMRTQWFQQTKSFETIASFNSVIQDAASKAPQLKNDKKLMGANDMSLIFGYMKMLDPNSTVREGEYANAENSGAISDKILNTYNKLLKGDILTEDQRKSFAESAQGLYQSQAKSYYSMKDQFQTIAKDNGYNPAAVTVSGVEANLPPAPKQAIDMLLKNPTPELKQAFMYKYGQETLNKALGNPQGGTSNAQ